MSNEEPEDRTPTDPVEYWGGSDFYGIAVSDDVIKLGVGSEDVSAEEARKALYTRLLAAQEAAGVDTNKRGSEAKSLAELIVQSLPQDAMRPEVLAAIDLRPYAARFVEVEAKTRSQDKALDFDESTDMVGRQAILDGLQAQAEQTVDENIAQYGLSEAQREEARRAILNFDPSTAGRSFEAVATERAAMFSQAAANNNLPTGVAGTNPMSADWAPQTLMERQVQQNGFPVKEFRQMLNNGITDLAGLWNEEINWQGNNQSSQFFPIDIRTTGGPSSAGDANTRTTETLSIMDALSYLEKLPEAQVADMQKKMAAAGYFNELDDPRAYVEGDAWDPATRQAWAALITESAQRNVPVTKLVGQRMQGYQERNRAAMEAQLLPIDDEYLKASADQAMLELVGRQMTVAESRQLVSYLDALRQERAGYIQGGGELNQGIDGPLRGDYGFDESDINLKIQQVAAPEVAGQAGWDTAQKVWQAFDLGDIDTKGVAEWRAQNRPAWMDEEDA